MERRTMRYELLHENNEGIKIYARIDDDGKCRFTCTEDNPEYQAWLNPVEHLTSPLTDPTA
jgi:hypothetical protein